MIKRANISSYINGENFDFCDLDDIIILSLTFEDNMKYLEIVLGKLKESGLTIHFEKSKFSCAKVKYQGFVVNENVCKSMTKKVNRFEIFQHQQLENIN